MKAGCMGKRKTLTLVCNHSFQLTSNVTPAAEREAAIYLLSFFPDISLTIDSYLLQRNALQDALWPTVPLLPGVQKLVHHLHSHKIPIAVATGSLRRNFELKTAHHSELFGYFEGNVVCGDDELKGGNGKIRGKPEPDVFLVAARETLGRNVGDREGCTDSQKVERSKGLVFEDALPGMQAGKRAGMSGKRCILSFLQNSSRSVVIKISSGLPVVWVPDANLLDVEYFGIERADQTLRSLEYFVPEQWGLPPYVT